jgi:DNA polymerase V
MNDYKQDLPPKPDHKANHILLNGFQVFTQEEVLGNPAKAIPLASSYISAGFPSPADDFLEKEVNLHDYLVKNKEATFFIKVLGDSMQNIGIFDKDFLIIDRSIKPKNEHIVLAILDGEFLVKRYSIQQGKVYLKPENPKYQPIEINPQQDFRIWGVVTYCIHKLS